MNTARLAAAALVAGAAVLAPVAAHADEDKVVTAAVPVFRDACGVDEDQVLIPYSEGVDYYFSGIKVNAGLHQVSTAVSPRVEVFTRAQDGYRLSEPATWAHTFDAERGCGDEGVVIIRGDVEDTPTATPSETEVPIVVPTETATQTQVIGGNDDDAETLPNTGFDSNTLMTGAGVAGLLAVLIGGGTIAYRRHADQGGAHNF